MSHVLTPILVDIAAVRRAVGGRDETLLAAILARHRDAEPFEYHDDDADRIGWRDALRRLIRGELLIEADADRYRHALELICAHLGAMILPDAWGGVDLDALGLVGLDTVLARGAPVPLPLDHVDPRVGYLTAAEVADRLEGLDVDFGPDPDPEAAELIAEYRDWLDRAAAERTGVVFFL